MKKTFLTGSFLPGYSSVFRYKTLAEKNTASLNKDQLAERFHARAERLRKNGSGYLLGIQGAAIFALVAVLLAFQIPVSGGGDFEVVEVKQELVTMEEIQQTKQQILPPPPPRPIIPVLVPDDELIVDEDLDLDAALELDEMLVDVMPPPPVEEEEPDEPEIFVAVESMPKMIGGMANLLKSVKYPVVARKGGVEGNVIVKIVVDEEGNPLNPTIMRSPSAVLDDAAVEAVMKQRFEPGRQRGRAVKVEVVIPVKFRLTG